MIKNRDIIVIGLQAWDITIGSNCRDLAKEFAKHNRVLYVNSPLDRATILRKRKDPAIKKRMDILHGKNEDLIRITDNLWTLYPRILLESVSRIPWNWLFDAGNRINNRRFAREILSAVRKLGFKDYILFNDTSIYRGLYMKELLHPRLYVYYDRDNLLAMDFWKKHAPRLEPELMRKADLVLTNSDFFTDRAKKYNPHSFNVGSGIDISLYNKKNIQSVPPDIASIPRPVIGYNGALLAMRLDLELIDYLARENPGWNIVLIGPEDEEFRTSSLHGRPNIHFLGHKKPQELPAYISSFDVAMNPQKVNEVTLVNYPRKIDEYLAMEKPVVATRTDAMVTLFSEYTYLAKDKVEFSAMIRKALEENSPEQEKKRRSYAVSHSWENNAAGILKLMKERMQSMYAETAGQ
jgi:glycosyltransferase involved in cell wall biosynthesis